MRLPITSGQSTSSWDWSRRCCIGLVRIGGRDILPSQKNTVLQAAANKIFEHLGKDVTLSTLSDTAKADRAEVLIINAPDNRHTLAIRILAAWFAVKGIPARVIDPIPPIDDFIAQIGESRLHLILISMALAGTVSCSCRAGGTHNGFAGHSPSQDSCWRIRRQDEPDTADSRR